VDQALRSSTEDSYELKSSGWFPSFIHCTNPMPPYWWPPLDSIAAPSRLWSAHWARVRYGCGTKAQPLGQLRFQLLTGWYLASPPGEQLPELHNGAIHESAGSKPGITTGLWRY